MEASIVDLRYRMNDVLKALRRNEKVSVLYHGKIEAVIVPAKKHKRISVKAHPFCGMHSKEKKSVESIVRDLRKFRYESI